jgi:hypothetical protein
MPEGSRDLRFGHAGAVSDWNICHRAGRGLGSPKEAKMKEPRQTFVEPRLSVGTGAACALPFGKDTSNLRNSPRAVLI